MGSAFLDLFCLVLQRIDRHPIGGMVGTDVDALSRAALDHLLGSGILVEQRPLDELDGCPVQWIGGRPFLFDLDGDRVPEAVDPRLLTRYEIDVSALCRALRRANRLDGPPVERISEFVHFIGHRGGGRRRRSICLARRLRDDDVLDTIHRLRARVGAGELVLLTPGAAELRPATLRGVAAEAALVLPIPDALDRAAAEALAVDLPAAIGGRSDAEPSARLRVDVRGSRATLDGGELRLAPRELELLAVLAKEAMEDNGFVGRDELLAVIEGERKGPDDAATPENLQNAVSRLRRALADAAGVPASGTTALVETKRGVGYRLGLKGLALEPRDIFVF